MRLWRRFVGSTRAKVAVGMLAGALIALPAGVWAATSFSDVPTSHPFYNEISAVAEAGIAQGFNDGTYRPANDITRQAMAAFMERGVGRAVSDAAHPLVVLVPNEDNEVAAVFLDGGATGAGTTGYVHLSASMYASSTNATTGGCPCRVEVRLMSGNAVVKASYLSVPLDANGDTAVGTTSLDTVVKVTGDFSRRYTLIARVLEGSAMISSDASLVATYFPLSGDGDNTATYEMSCPKDDPFEQNDAYGSEAILYFGATTTAAVCPGDPDWYFDPDQVDFSSMINVTVDQFNNAEGNIDVCLYRFSSQVACSTGTGNSEVISYPVALSGTFSIHVYLAADAGSLPGNTYTLTTTQIGP